MTDEHPAEVLDLLARFRRAESNPHRSHLSVPCPHCRAGVNQSCTVVGLTDRRLTLVPAHPSRFEAAGLDPVAEPLGDRPERPVPDGAA